MMRAFAALGLSMAEYHFLTAAHICGALADRLLG